MMHGYNHNTDDKAQLINDNLDIVKKIAFFYVGRVGKVVEVDEHKGDRTVTLGLFKCGSKSGMEAGTVRQTG